MWITGHNTQNRMLHVVIDGHIALVLAKLMLTGQNLIGRKQSVF